MARSRAQRAVSRARRPDRKAFGAAADAILEGAAGFAHNSFKIELARRAIIRALEQAAAGTPQSQSVKVDPLGLVMTVISTNSIGKPVSRVDGPAKVTGQAKYAAEFNVPDLAYGFVVSSAIAKGRIKSIDRTAALAVPGVIEVFAHDNRPSVASSHKKYTDEAASPGSPFRPLYDENILFAGQPDSAWWSRRSSRSPGSRQRLSTSSMRRRRRSPISIRKSTKPTNLRKSEWSPWRRRASRGDADKALSQSPIREAQDYRTPMEHHNPMECFGSTAVWDEDGRLTIYDKTQGAQNSHRYVCNVFGLAKDKVRVLSPFVGGAFGCGLRPQYQLFLAAMAAIGLKRSVRVALTRQQMILGFGHRPQTIQTLSLGAEENGHLTAMKHDAVANTSRFEDYQENVVNWAGSLYRCDNSEVSHKLVQLDLATPDGYARARSRGGCLCARMRDGRA